MLTDFWAAAAGRRGDQVQGRGRHCQSCDGRRSPVRPAVARRELLGAAVRATVWARAASEPARVPTGALQFVVAELKPGVKVYDLCVKGDKFMEECAASQLHPRCAARGGRRDTAAPCRVSS